MKDRSIYVFAAYKFESKYYMKRVLEKAIKEAVNNVDQKLQNKINGLRVRLIEQKEIESGDYIYDFVINSIDKASISIFELSDRAHNVIFELGYSTGIAKSKFSKEGGYDIIIQSADVDFKDILSDLLGKFLITYNHRNKSRKENYKKIRITVEKELTRKINKLITDETFLKTSIWRMYGEEVNVICPYIPTEDQRKYGVKSSFSYYGDFNAVYEVCTFLKGFLRCDVKYYHCQEAKAIKNLYENHVIIIGGPMWNHEARKFIKDYNMPYYYDWNEDIDKDDYIKCIDSANRIKINKIQKDNDSYITKDFGIYSILPNPYNKEKCIILINGLSSLGSLGAVRAFTESKNANHNCNSLLHSVGHSNYFSTLIECDVQWDLVPYPKRIRNTNIYLYNVKANSWKKC